MHVSLMLKRQSPTHVLFFMQDYTPHPDPHSRLTSHTSEPHQLSLIFFLSLNAKKISRWSEHFKNKPASSGLIATRVRALLIFFFFDFSRTPPSLLRWSCRLPCNHLYLIHGYRPHCWLAGCLRKIKLLTNLLTMTSDDSQTRNKNAIERKYSPFRLYPTLCKSMAKKIPHRKSNKCYFWQWVLEQLSHLRVVVSKMRQAFIFPDEDFFWLVQS